MVRKYFSAICVFLLLLTSCSAIQNQEAASRDLRKVLKGLTAARKGIESITPEVVAEIKKSKKSQTALNDKLSYIEKEILNLKINQANQLRDSGGVSDLLEQISSKLEEYNYRVSAVTQRLESIDSRISQLSDVYKAVAEREDSSSSEEKASRKKEGVRWANMGDSILAIQSDLAELKTFVDAIGSSRRSGNGKAAKIPPFKPSMKPVGDRRILKKLPRPVNPGAVSAAAGHQQSRVVSIAPGQLYSTAYKDYLKGNFNLAISEFTEYLKKFPGTEASANAMYWMGESYFARKSYPASIDAFNRLKQKYPKSIKIPSAMLKISYSYIKLDKRKKAVEILEGLIADFPDSGESELAKDTLSDLKNK